MKKISNHQRAARKHNMDESSQSLRDAVKAGKTSKPKADKELKKFAKALRKDDPTQDRPPRHKD
jgi:hypothetical protein